MLAWVCVGAGLLALVRAAQADAAAARSEGVTLTVAQFEYDARPPREVQLPHTWALDGLTPTGAGRYRLTFELMQAPQRPWALVASRLATRHVLRLNGSVVHTGDAYEHRGAPAPVAIDLPPALFRTGSNEIDLEVTFDVRAGLSPIRVGPSDQVLPFHVRDEMWNVVVPQAANIVASGLALFMLTIWLRRRSEHELGAFSGLMAAVSLRNVISTGSGNQWHNAGTDFALYALQVASVVLLARFAIAFSRRDAPLLRRCTDLAGLVFWTLGALAAWHEWLAALRVYVYPVLLLLVTPSLWLLGVAAKQARGARQAALTLAVMLLAGAAVHDYFYLRGLVSVLDRYWMPLTSPLALLIFAWTLLDRFIGALSAVETQAIDLERKVAERTSELERANAAKTRFLAAASHDLRQPVVSIGLLSDLLRERPNAPEARQVLERMGDSVQALNGLLNGLLDLSRFDAGAVKARLTRVSLRPLVEAVLGDEREHAQRKGLSLRARIPLWEVHSDPVLLEQILRNLVGNAVRYTERGGVLVAARRRGEAVRVEVWDTGVGIAAEHQSVVFEEFVQLDNAALARSRGLGLGLSLVRRAAAVLQAPLTLRSVTRRGSCFAIELPFVGAAVQSFATAKASGDDLRGWRIWLVEDEPDVRQALQLRLSAWGAEVSAFVGATAVQAALNGIAPTPHLLVTDQRLGDGSGLAVIRLVHTHHPGLPVLIVTGDTAPVDVSLLARSAHPVLHKPFTSVELLAAVVGLLRTPGVRGAGRGALRPPPPVSAS